MREERKRLSFVDVLKCIVGDGKVRVQKTRVWHSGLIPPFGVLARRNLPHSVCMRRRFLLHQPSSEHYISISIFDYTFSTSSRSGISCPASPLDSNLGLSVFTWPSVNTVYTGVKCIKRGIKTLFLSPKQSSIHPQFNANICRRIGSTCCRPGWQSLSLTSIQLYGH